jgi:hypothetical protein
MKKLMVRAGLLWILLVTMLPGHAREMDGLYQAEMPVKSQDREERLTAYAGAIAQVVVKVTGDRRAPQQPRLAKAMASAQNWVQQYRYQELPEPGALVLKEQGYTRLLVVQFDETAVNQALVAAAAPLWGRVRPDLLVLLAVDDGGSRYLLVANDVTELGSSLDANVQRRGLPLLLPRMEDVNQRRIVFADVWSDASQPIMDVSKDYNANAVLAGRISRSNGGWQGRWSLYQGDEVQHWQGNGIQQNDVVATGIDGAADRLARRYAQLLTTTAAADAVAVTVTEVTTLAAYARAMQYLQSLDLVTNVQVAKVQGGEVLFSLNVRGDINGIDRAIALGGTLRRTMTEDNQPLVYQLLP